MHHHRMRMPCCKRRNRTAGGCMRSQDPVSTATLHQVSEYSEGRITSGDHEPVTLTVREHLHGAIGGDHCVSESPPFSIYHSVLRRYRHQ